MIRDLIRKRTLIKSVIAFLTMPFLFGLSSISYEDNPDFFWSSSELSSSDLQRLKEFNIKVTESCMTEHWKGRKTEWNSVVAIIEFSKLKGTKVSLFVKHGTIELNKEMFLNLRKCVGVLAKTTYLEDIENTFVYRARFRRLF